MVQMTKEEFYRERGKMYPSEDREALIRYKKAIEWIDFTENLVIREIGCKYAVIRDLLTRFSGNVDYMAADIDEETLRKIPGYDPKIFLTHNVNSGLPFAGESADYIVCLEVLEHLEDATRFLSEVSRVLKPNGRLILSVPNPYCWMELQDNLRRFPDGEGHIASYTHQNIDALSRFCGFRLDKMRGTFTRIPFTSRIFGKYVLVETDNTFLTRSFMFLLKKNSGESAT